MVTTVVFLGSAVLLLNPLVSDRAAFGGNVGPSCLLSWRTPLLGACFGSRCGRAGPGEWLGSLAETLAFVAVLSWGLGSWGCFACSSTVFFLTHSVGYFARGWLMAWIIQSHAGGVLGGLSKDLVGILAKLG